MMPNIRIYKFLIPINDDKNKNKEPHFEVKTVCKCYNLVMIDYLIQVQ